MWEIPTGKPEGPIKASRSWGPKKCLDNGATHEEGHAMVQGRPNKEHATISVALLALVALSFAMPEYAQGLSITDPGTIAYYSTLDGDAEIYLMNPDGSNRSQVTHNTASDTGVSWSPDGGRVAFASDRSGRLQIYVMNADGTNPVRLTNNSANDFDPSWSPDGRKIAFRTDRDGNEEVYLINVDGTNPVNLTRHPSRDGEPQWSPDGSKIVFSSWRDGGAEIYVMKADGTDPTKVTSGRTWSSNPRWSPDGAKIGYTSWGELYAMNADGNNRVRLTSNSAEDYFGSWSPDGSKIAFFSNRDGNHEIYTMNADGTIPIRLTNNVAGDGGPTWSWKIINITHAPGLFPDTPTPLPPPPIPPPFDPAVDGPSSHYLAYVGESWWAVWARYNLGSAAKSVLSWVAQETGSVVSSIGVPFVAIATNVLTAGVEWLPIEIRDIGEMRTILLNNPDFYYSAYERAISNYEDLGFPPEAAVAVAFNGKLIWSSFTEKMTIGNMLLSSVQAFISGQSKDEGEKQWRSRVQQWEQRVKESTGATAPDVTPVTNGEFQNGNLAGWEVGGQGSAHVIEFPLGNPLALLTSGSPVTLSQGINTPLMPFYIDFDYWFLNTMGSLEVWLDTILLDTINAPSTLLADFTHYRFFVSDPNLLGLTAGRFALTYDGPGGSQMLLDNVAIHATPEPASFLLLASGVAMLVLLTRKRRGMFRG
jgi:hypothetical protein